MKILHYTLAAASAVWSGACTVAPSPVAPSAIATPDALVIADGFEPIFFRAFVQNGFESPDRLEPIRMLRGPLRIYLRTHDEEGGAIDSKSLGATERILMDSVWAWSGETFGFAEVARGSGTRDRVPGWITVKWSGAPANDRCGRSTVGVDGGFIEFNISGACRCGTAAPIYPRLIRHELGHAMGYYHTDSASDVMYGRSITSDACDTLPSDRERRHAKLLYSQLQ